jgi:hypothetical protein
MSIELFKHILFVCDATGHFKPIFIPSRHGYDSGGLPIVVAGRENFDTAYVLG